MLCLVSLMSVLHLCNTEVMKHVDGEAELTQCIYTLVMDFLYEKGLPEIQLVDKELSCYLQSPDADSETNQNTFPKSSTWQSAVHSCHTLPLRACF